MKRHRILIDPVNDTITFRPGHYDHVGAVSSVGTEPKPVVQQIKLPVTPLKPPVHILKRAEVLPLPPVITPQTKCKTIPSDPLSSKSKTTPFNITQLGASDFRSL